MLRLTLFAVVCLGMSAASQIHIPKTRYETFRVSEPEMIKYEPPKLKLVKVDSPALDQYVSSRAVGQQNTVAETIDLAQLLQQVDTAIDEDGAVAQQNTDAETLNLAQLLQQVENADNEDGAMAQQNTDSQTQGHVQLLQQVDTADDGEQGCAGLRRALTSKACMGKSSRCRAQQYLFCRKGCNRPRKPIPAGCATCRMYCQYGFVDGDDGCPLCQCQQRERSDGYCTRTTGFRCRDVQRKVKAKGCSGFESQPAQRRKCVDAARRLKNCFSFKLRLAKYLKG